MCINVARLPYKLVESLAQGLPELITSPSFRVIFIFIRSTIRSDCNFFVALVRKLIGKELVMMPIVTSAEKEMLKRGTNEEPQTEKT